MDISEPPVGHGELARIFFLRPVTEEERRARLEAIKKIVVMSDDGVGEYPCRTEVDADGNVLIHINPGEA